MHTVHTEKNARSIRTPVGLYALFWRFLKFLSSSKHNVLTAKFRTKNLCTNVVSNKNMESALYDIYSLVEASQKTDSFAAHTHSILLNSGIKISFLTFL